MSEKYGWIKLYRKILDNPIVMKDAHHLAIWVYLILSATHDEYPALFKGEKIMLQPGQLITGRKSIADKLAINESKVTRVLDTFISEQQIEQQTSNKNRLISIVNWELYQQSEQQSEQQANNKRTTSEQQVNTNKNNKNNKNDKNVRNKKSASDNAHSSSKTDINTFFESVWKLYPVKKGKGQISDSKKKSLYEIGYEELKRAIDRYLQELKKEEWRKPQNGSTFFNSGYIDYLDANFVPSEPQPQKKNSFNNFNQRQYNYDELESKLLAEGANTRKAVDDP